MALRMKTASACTVEDLGDLRLVCANMSTIALLIIISGVPCQQDPCKSIE